MPSPSAKRTRPDLSTRSRLLGDEHGGVTAEFAIALPAIMLVLAFCLAAMQLASVQIRVQDAAALAARSIARDDEASLALAAQLVPGVTFARSQRGELVCVTAVAPAAGGATPVLGIRVQAISCGLGGGL
jgi:Flp pilus assembly protein TadG